MARPTEPTTGFGPSVHQRVRKFTGDSAMRAPRREMPMGARRESLEAARRIKLSPLLSRPDLDALERGLDLLDDLCGPQKPRSPLDRPQIGPAEVKELIELLPELTKLHTSRDPLLLHYTRAWREAGRSHSEMALRLRTAFACGYLPVDPPDSDARWGIPWDARDLAIVEAVLAALPQQFKRLGSIRLVRMLPTAPEHPELNDLKEAWRATPDALKQNVTGKIARVKNALRVRLLPEPSGVDTVGEVKAIHLPGELLAVSKLRGLRGTCAMGVIYALAEEHHRVDPKERELFDQKLDRALRRERMAEDPARAYALGVAAFALSPALLEEKYPKTHNHMLDRFDTSLASYDGGALMRPAVEALLALR